MNKVRLWTSFVDACKFYFSCLIVAILLIAVGTYLGNAPDGVKFGVGLLFLFCCCWGAIYSYGSEQ